MKSVFDSASLVRRFAGRAAAVAIALLSLGAISCSGRLEATIRNDLSARMALRVEVPETLGARVRQIGGLSSKAYLFDMARLQKEFSSRTSIFLVDVSTPSQDSLTSVIWIPNLAAFTSDKTIVPPGMIALKTIPAAGGEPAKRELSITLNRANAAAAYRLFPGIDSRLIDSLGPPALEDDPITASEYRMNLETVIIGKKAMPAFDACAIELTITAPKSILSASGGSFQNQVFKARIPFFDLLTLERPISLALRWAE